jgi:hypothetical protein
MTDPKPVVSGALLRPIFNALGVPWRLVTETRIVPPDLIEVTYVLLGEQGEKYRAGDRAASVTLHARVDWDDPGPESAFGLDDTSAELG